MPLVVGLMCNLSQRGVINNVISHVIIGIIRSFIFRCSVLDFDQYRNRFYINRTCSDSCNCEQSVVWCKSYFILLLLVCEIVKN